VTLSIETRANLDAPDIAAVTALLDAVTDADGITPTSEHVLLHLRHGGDREGRNLLARLDGELAGYAHLDVTDRVEGPSAELAVHPRFRRHGVASALLSALEKASADAGHRDTPRLWAHGRLPGAAALAHARGYVEERVLLQLRRSLLSELPDRPLPEGLRLRPFVPDQDEAAWLVVNNRAFADHPDQGGWTESDIRIREREPWFDPDGFLLAMRESDGALRGFHWTKVHGHDPNAHGGAHAHAPIGEVYVVGIDPDAQGTGLGSALTAAGLRYLRSRGLAQVMLYVDESNAAAVHTYDKLGFTRWDADVRYRRRSP
jgi:mycothiol synthase